MESLLNIDPLRKTPKYLQIVHCINQAIMRGRLRKGDQISSINELSEEYLLGRETVQKAYNILRKEGVVVGVPGKGFFVNRTDIHAPFRVVMLFNKMSHYKAEIYNGFVRALGRKAVYDLKIHHSDIRLFERQLMEKQGEYDFYAVVPHFFETGERVADLLQKVPAGKLVLLDKDIREYRLPCAAVYQDYPNDLYDALEQGSDLLAKYKELLLIHGENGCSGNFDVGLRNFCLNHRFAHRILPGLPAGWRVRQGQAYVVVDDLQLAKLIRLCEAERLEIGKEVGILSYNDTPLKEILLGGITVIGTDHGRMGELAAQLILENRREKVKNPFQLVRRLTL